MQEVNVYDLDALKALLEEEAPRWKARREGLRRAGDPRWLVLAEQERRLWLMVIDLASRFRKLIGTVWSIVVMLQADDPTLQALGVRLLADLVRPPRPSSEEWDELCHRAAKAGMDAQAYLRHVVMPEALLLVCASLHVPRRIQLGPRGQGRVLNAEGQWTPQAPIERLGIGWLSFYIVQQVPKAAQCILSDAEYPKSRTDAYDGGHAIRSQGRTRRIGPPVSLFTRTNKGGGHKPLELIDGIPSPQATPEELVRLKEEKEQQHTMRRQLEQLASSQGRDILYGLSLGLTPSEIARALGISRQAVNTQIRRLREKGEREHVFDFMKV